MRKSIEHRIRSGARDEALKVYLSTPEAYNVKKCARMLGLTVSAYIRGKILESLSDDEYMYMTSHKIGTKKWR